MYETGDWVVYGIHGVCKVVGKEKQLLNRKRTEFLVLKPESKSESRFYLPTNNEAVMAKLKTVLSEKELQALFESDQILEDTWIPEENLRKQTYHDLICGIDRMGLLKMLGSVYRYKVQQAAAGRKFHLCDDNFMRDAEKLISSEIALVFRMTPEDAKSYLWEHLKAG